MKVYFENSINEIKNIVEQKAKFQKVMLLFDENVSTGDINSVYEEIRDVCVYNQCNISLLDEKEIFDGYRLIIYYCSADNYLKCNFNKDEFINVFLLQDNNVLTFVLNNSNTISNLDNHIILKSKQIDLKMLISINLNLFYNYFNKFLFGQNVNMFIEYLDNQPITQQSIFEFLKVNNDLSFIDVEMLKKCDISYDDIFIVDLMIIDLMLLLITKIKSGNLMFVDVYKHCKININFVEKFYKFYQDDSFLNTIILNYNHLYKYCVRTRNKILELIKFFKVDMEKIDTIVKKIEDFAILDNGVLGYAYFYDVFNF